MSLSSPKAYCSVRSSIGVLAMLTAAACGRSSDTAANAVKGAEEAMPSMAPVPPVPAAPNDAQIVDIVMTADAIDSAAGVVARQKAQAKDVKDFAQMMVTDHGALNAQAQALATKLGLIPEANDISPQLNTGADESATKLAELAGAAFDRAYIAREVAFHEAVISTLDDTLLPDAQDPELKALLEKSRPIFVAHLDRARALLASFN